MRAFWWIGCIVVLALVTHQGCSCARIIEIPGSESKRSDGGGVGDQIQTPPDRQSADEPARTDTAEPSTERVPESVSEPIPEPLVDQAPSACSDGSQNFYCQRCKWQMSMNETILGIHRHFLLTQVDPTINRLTVIDLRICKRRTVDWAGPPRLALLLGDPDSNQVLLLGTGQQANPGAPRKSQLGIIDLDAPETPKALFPLPDNTRQDLSKSSFAASGRRGIAAFSIENADGSQTPLYIHYAMAGSRLEKLSLPKDYQLTSPTGFNQMFPEVELYPLLRSSPRALGLAVWSVQDQKLLNMLDITNDGIPTQAYATAKHLFALKRDPEDKTQKRLYRVDITTATSTPLPVKGCASLSADSQLKLLYCIANDTIHRLQLPEGKVLSPIGNSDRFQPYAYFKGKLFYTEPNEPGQFKVIDLMQPTPATKKVGQPLPGKPQYGPGPTPPRVHSAKTYPGPSYRLVRSQTDQGQRVAVLDLARDELRLSKDIFPLPAVMGRQTEFWHFFPQGFAYAVEPVSPTPDNAATFFVRLDTAAVFHKVQGLLVTSQRYATQGVTQAPYIAILQARYSKDSPPKAEHTLHLAHFGLAKAAMVPLAEKHELYQSSSHVVLGPTLNTQPRELIVYEVKP